MVLLIVLHMYPYFLFAAIHHLKSSPTFSVRPCSSVGRVTVDLIRRSWVRFPPRSKDFFFASRGSLFPLTRANAQWVIHGLSSTIIYTSELILCSTTYCNVRFWRAKRRLSWTYFGNTNSEPYLLIKRRFLTISADVQRFFEEYLCPPGRRFGIIKPLTLHKSPACLKE